MDVQGIKNLIQERIEAVTRHYEQASRWSDMGGDDLVSQQKREGARLGMSMDLARKNELQGLLHDIETNDVSSGAESPVSTH